MTRLSPVLMLLAIGCTPNNATLTGGEYLAFFPTDGSPVLNEGRIKIDEEGARTTVNCSTNVAEATNTADCAALEATSGVQRPHEPWTDDDSFEVVWSPISPWRGEGIITNEGDLQVLFHHRLSGNEDFRFLFVVDTDFQPLRCVQGDSGPLWENVDGDWLGNWSEGANGATRFYLNAGSSQFDPNPTTWKPFEFDWNEWFIPDEWRAGYAVGRYGPSRIATRRSQYEYPWLRAEMAQDWAGVTTTQEQAIIEDPAQVFFYEADCADVQAVADGIAADLAAMTVGVPGGIGNISLAPQVECNAWREPDGIAAGLDGWRELQYSWVDINEDPASLAVGDSVSGHFRLVLDGFDSQTVIFVEGDFAVDKIKRERWGNPDLNAELLEQNGVELCAGSPAAARLNTTAGFEILDNWDLGR